jgi:MinD superfamily P-loop ATPase
MKQLLILSGKGGTGKTTIASAFIRLSDAKVYADCDVDAPNLHLVMTQNMEPKHTDYYGMPKAHLDADKCVGCGLCKDNCRFDAISDEQGYLIDLFACEGCGVCEAVCPAGAVTMIPAVAGALTLYADNNRVFSTAQLKMGNGTSGMLVTEVKEHMKATAAHDAKLAVIDGSPGIGCPVIASLCGVDMVLIVAEPSISGISDMERIIKTSETFKTKIGLCINKYDTNLKNTQTIEDYCLTKGLSFTGRIPFDPEAVKAINNGQTIVDIDCPSGSAVREVFSSTMDLLFHESEDSKA